ncbi:MAG: hypothetical protein FH751_00950 [Firmicutes bacterium]|nr:hypothetical protein [Bacillota bacterium]
MKKQKVLITSLVILMMLTLIFALNVSAVSEEKHEYLQEAKILLQKRTKVMNDAIYENKKLSLVKKELEKIEKGSCYDWDIEVIENFRKNPTDYCYVHDFKVSEVKNIDIKDNMINFKLLITWNIEDYNGKMEIKEKYNLKIVKLEDSFYIEKFDIIK